MGIVEQQIRQYKLGGGLMSWHGAEALASLDVIAVGHTFNIPDAALERIHQTVRAGVGLYNESYLDWEDTLRQKNMSELSLGKPPFYTFCTPGGHGRPRPVKVQHPHPIIEGLSVGDGFDVPGCGLIYTPVPGARVLIAREDAVRPSFADVPGFVPTRIPILMTGQVGTGRVVKVNTVSGRPFHTHPALRGRFVTNCFNWLADPRREAVA